MKIRRFNQGEKGEMCVWGSSAQVFLQNAQKIQFFQIETTKQELSKSLKYTQSL